MFICPQCGGQNALHFSFCPHYANGPRVHASPKPGNVAPGKPGPLPYMHNRVDPHGTRDVMRYAAELVRKDLEPAVAIFKGSQQAADPSQPHRSMPAMSDFVQSDEQKLVALLGPKLDTPFTHRDKGGRYKLIYTPIPAGAAMRKVGDTVVYSSLDTLAVYVRDLKDFVAIMQPLLLSDN